MASHEMRAMLESVQERISLHMPGHGGRAPEGLHDLYALDTTELPVTDDLYAPLGAISRAQQAYSACTGAGATLFLHNGSSQGVHLLLETYAGEGECVILPRNSHLSAVSGCILGGITPIWVEARTVGDAVYVDPQDILATMRAHPEAKAVLLTRPDYFGGCLSMEEIHREAKRLGMRLVVDEAHGAHLPWHADIGSSGEYGADAWVQSVHKTLHGLTGSAVIHFRDASDARRALRILRWEQTSSPSFLLMLSIDEARCFMEERGRAALERQRAQAEEIVRTASTRGYTDPRPTWTSVNGYAYDRQRVVLHVPEGGSVLSEALEARSIDVEMSLGHSLVMLLPLEMPDAHVRHILESLSEMRAGEDADHPAVTGRERLPLQVMPPRRAALGRTREVDLHTAAGSISAVSAGCYPPGIPLVVPGEIISEETAARLLRAGTNTFGIQGERITCVDA